MTEKPTPIFDALNKTIEIPKVEDQSADLAVEKTRDDLGITGSASVDIGKPGGWSLGGAGGYWKNAGATVKGWVKWRGKK